MIATSLPQLVLALNRRPTEYIRKARREAERVIGFLRPALAAAGAVDLAERVAVRPLMPAVLNDAEVDAVFEVARPPVDHLELRAILALTVVTAWR